MRPNGAFQSSQTSDGADGKNRGSKQKIIQLKDELNGASLQINPKFEKLKVLRESYDIAKFRANELLLPHDQNLYLKAHGLRASKIYSALSTLIFVSISCSKVEELEEYVMKSAAQVPSTIFDLEEWSSIVKIAKDCREGDTNSLKEQISALKKNMIVYNQLAANPLKAAQMELKLLRSEVLNELGGAQADLAGSINLIMQLAQELSGGSGSEISENARRLNQLLHATDSHDRNAEKAKNEELEALRLFQKNASEELNKLTHESSELRAELKSTTARADSAEAQNRQLVINVGDLTREIDSVKAAAAASPRHITSEQQAQQVRDFQELYEQYSHLSTTLHQRDEQIAELEERIKGGSLKKRMDEEEQTEPAPAPTPQIQIDLENQVSALTQYVTELEHNIHKEKEKIKSLSTEVRLTEAARCEAAGYAETAAQELGYAKEDIFSLQAEVAALRAALHAHNAHTSAERVVSVPKGISPRATSPMGSFSSMLRIDTRRGSFSTIVEVKEEDEVVNTLTEDDVSLVTEAAMETPVITPVAGQSTRTGSSPPDYPTILESEEPAVVEQAVLSEDDAKIIAAEAEHTAASAIFIGKVQVALLQEEFAHHQPQILPVVDADVPSVVLGTVQSIDEPQDSSSAKVDVSARVEETSGAVEEVPVVEEQPEVVPIEPDTEISTAPAQPSNPNLAEESSQDGVNVKGGDTISPTSAVEGPLPVGVDTARADAELISVEAARVATSAVFLGAVHVAVLQDEFVHHGSHEPQTAAASDSLVDVSAVVPEATFERGVFDAAPAGDTTSLAEADIESTVVHSTKETAEPSQQLETNRVSEALPELLLHEVLAAMSAEANAAASTSVKEPAHATPTEEDSRIIAAEAAHAAASALFLGTVHVAVMQEEFRPHAQAAATITFPPVDAVEIITQILTKVVEEIVASVSPVDAVKEAPIEADTAVSVEAPADVSVDAPPAESADVVVVCERADVVASESATLLDTQFKVVAPPDDDLRIIADEAARVVNTTVFLGAVHVAVMQDEFSQHTHVDSAPADALEATANEEPTVVSSLISASSKQESVFNISSETPEQNVAVPVSLPEFLLHEIVSTIKEEKMIAESDAQIVADEAARTVASSVFLGAMHVAVMKDEFVHLRVHSPALENTDNPSNQIAVENVDAIGEVCEPISKTEPEPVPVSEPDLEALPELLLHEILAAMSAEANAAASSSAKEPAHAAPTDEDSRIIAAEAAHAAASALFLGTVHVAVMQEEFHPHSHVAASISTEQVVEKAVEENAQGVVGASSDSLKSPEPEDLVSVKSELVPDESTKLTSPASVARVESASKVDLEPRSEAEHVDSVIQVKESAAIEGYSDENVVPTLGATTESAPEPEVVTGSASEPEIEGASPSVLEEVMQTVKALVSEVESPAPQDPPGSSVGGGTVAGPSEADIGPLDTPVEVARVDELVSSTEQKQSEDGSNVSKFDFPVSAIEIELDTAVTNASAKSERTEKVVSAPWKITAAKNTEQGKSGWYTDKEQLFYYCADNGEPVLLCGPVSEDVYQMALAAEKAASNDLSAPAEVSSSITIDRVGVRATRLQAESLREEVLNLEQKHAQALQDLEQARALTEAELYDCQATVQTLNEEITHCKDIIRHLESHRRRSQLSYAAAEQMKAKIAKLTIEQVVALIKLTSMARGYIGRARVRRIHTSKQAQEAGLLYAMSNTKQGESGWYMGPKRNIFYFAQKNGAWTNVAGPLTEEDFELMVMARKQKQVSNSQEVLTLVHVKLQPDYEALVDGGELYVANVTDKVFVCKPLDSLVTGNTPNALSPTSMLEQEQKQEQEVVPKPSEQLSLNVDVAPAEEMQPTTTHTPHTPHSIPEDHEMLRKESFDDIQEPALVSMQSAPSVRLKSATERQISFLERAASADVSILHSSADVDDARSAREGRWQ